MFKKRNLTFICLLILGVLLITSCLPKPPVTEGILKGQVIVPEGSKQMTGQALVDATVNIIDPAAGDIIATTTTDANGYYQVFVPAGGPYLLQAVKDGVKLLQITPQVEAGIEYDLGTADCSTTAVALIAQAMLDAEDYPDNLADINLADIEADPDFNDVMNPVCSTIEAGEDPTLSAVVQQAVEDFLFPPAPAPTPTPTYTVTFDSQGGSGVVSQTVEQGEKVTEPTAPTKTGHTFGGWYKESVCTIAWDFDTDTVTSDVILYAKWTGSVHNTTQNIYYTTIQAALDDAAAVSGDIIRVDDGTYTENITFPSGKAIVLESVNGRDFTTIEGGGSGSVVTIGSCLNGTTMDGFTITGGNKNNGGGIDIHDSSPTIQNNIISGNTASINGGGIYILSGSPTIQYNTISGNTATNATDVLPGTGRGGGIYILNSSPTIQYNTISENMADINGGGIYIDHGSPTIQDNTISENETIYGGGILMVDSSPIIQDNTISENMADSNGGGIYILSSSPTIQDNTISGNTNGNLGSGICIVNCPSPTYIVTIQNNTISGNASSALGGVSGGICIFSSSPTIGGVDGSDTVNFNTICGNTVNGTATVANQIYPDPGTYPNNYIFTSCDVIGETGPAGGWIFYDKGYVSDGWRYLEAAPSDQSASAEWDCAGTSISGADGTAVGTGEQNTIDIEAVCATVGTAADICANLSLGGYDDWFLPSLDELNLMYTNLKVAGVGGFADYIYWSSSEELDTHAWYQDFIGGDQSTSGKNASLRVRAIRAF